MSESLSLTNNQSNFAFIRALVFSPGKKGANWFKATVGDALVMVFYPDDGSITVEMIQPGDTIFVAGLKDMDVPGTCDKKANCAPLALQIDSFKNACNYRQKNIKQHDALEVILEPVLEKLDSENQAQEKIEANSTVNVEESLRFNGLVRGKENVEFVNAKKQKYAARGRMRSMFAINEIVELARKNES